MAEWLTHLFIASPIVFASALSRSLQRWVDVSAAWGPLDGGGLNSSKACAEVSGLSTSNGTTLSLSPLFPSHSSLPLGRVCAQ